MGQVFPLSSKRVQRVTRHTFGCAKVQHVAVLPEHIDLLNTRNGLHVELLERALQLFVVLRGGRLGLAHDLAAHRALPTCAPRVSTAGEDLAVVEVEPQVHLRTGPGTDQAVQRRVALGAVLRTPLQQVEDERQRGARCSFVLERPAYAQPRYRAARLSHPS